MKQWGAMGLKHGCSALGSSIEKPPGLAINVSGVLPGHLVASFLYILCALGSIGVFILTVLMKLRMHWEDQLFP